MYFSVLFEVTMQSSILYTDQARNVQNMKEIGALGV